ncbi:type VI secretion system protein TssA [Terracidiphilus gabretensis]|uniref:type VI secretion system protein TssA n=1 Tax=Terracidiphilus gabretensis TaxID=1577687 RepID=UPI00071BC0D6|nr:type VI secretion system protein TssA [Terracidiphilus gabretensis]
MPLRDDLLTPIEGDNPSGPELYYDPVFEQIKEARREDVDDLPSGGWDVANRKKADFRTANKLSGETVAKRSKDLRLAGWYIESSIRLEGFSVLAPSIELLRGLQETFWDTIYPMMEDGGDLEYRAMSVDAATRLLTDAVRKLPLTKSGLSFEVYKDARIVGYEKDATSDSRRESREDAIKRGRLTAEDFDQAFLATPKAVYSDADAALRATLEAVAALDSYQREAYGSDFYPSLDKFQESLEAVHGVVETLLNEKRKTEPDPVAPRAPGEGGEDEGAGGGAQVGIPGFSLQITRMAAPGELGAAYGSVVASAEYFFDADSRSAVPYLICAGLRLGETLMQGQSPQPGFAVGPTPDVRFALRSLAQQGAWAQLIRVSLPILASECARGWLDLHRYIWRAAQEIGADALSAAVVGTIRNLLAVQPELRYWILEDDTGAANPETQRWIDSTVLGQG